MNIGTIELNNPIALAPMEDVTDSAFRLICKRLGADLLFTEFTSSEALVRDIQSAIHKIEFEEEERPLAIQIFGGVEESMERAAQRAEMLNPDFIDINCGCWVKNHVARGHGAALLHPEGIITARQRGCKANRTGCRTEIVQDICPNLPRTCTKVRPTQQVRDICSGRFGKNVSALNRHEGAIIIGQVRT